jgi:hypothetical protein
VENASMTTISQRASATVKQPKPKTQRVCCPYCEATFDLGNNSKPRSPDQHKRFFSVIRFAFEQWPDTHDFIPDNAEHLRAWLICKAGARYRDVETFEIPQTDDPTLMARMMGFAESMLNKDKGKKFARWRGLTLTIFRPKSIKFHLLQHLAFVELNSRVDEIIKAEIGVTGDELLEQAKRNV